MTDALIGRLTHKGHIIEFVSEFYRFRYRLHKSNRQQKRAKRTLGKALLFAQGYSKG